MKLRRTVVTLVLAAALAVPLLPTQASAATMYPGPWVNQAAYQTGYWYGPMEMSFGRNAGWSGPGGWGWSNMSGQGWGCGW